MIPSPSGAVFIRQRRCLRIVSTFCFLFLLQAGTAGLLCPVEAESAAKQDGRFLERLRWTAPHGELPGTHEEYIEGHPLSPLRITPVTGRFEGTGSFPGQVLQRDRRGGSREAPAPSPRTWLVPAPYRILTILIDEELYPDISDALIQYRSTLRQRAYGSRVALVSGGSPEEIRAYIQQEYELGSQGVLLIGDVTAAWLEVSGEVFPGDLYYMDLDGEWLDLDKDGDFETHQPGTGDTAPEIFVARLDAASLSFGPEADLVNDYFSKVQSYRDGFLIQPWRGLEYVDEDWYSMAVNLDLIYGTEVVRHDYGYFTTAADYVDQMSLGQHFVQVCAHSYSGGHHFSMRPTESASYAHLYVYCPDTRTARLLLGSDDGIRVWLNGELICTHDVYQDWQPDQFDHDVTLQEGWNRLLCKVSQEGGSHGFSARFTDPGGDTFDDLEYRTKDPAVHDREGEFIRSWLINGFHQDSSDNFWSYLTTNYLGVPESDVDPVEGQVHGGKTWTVMEYGCPYIDLDSYSGGADFGASYAFTRITADSAVSCELRLGYDDGTRVWLNGEVVLYDNRYGGYEQDMTAVAVDLAAGENRLLVKVSEWMGSHGFSARFCDSDGGFVGGLSYDPPPRPVDYIGTWLVNGPYVNPDQDSRLITDYLGGEADVVPDEGDPAPFGTWESSAGSGEPFDLAGFFDTDGGWVYSEDVQDDDPPVIFYNLFACGPGRFTDTDYLAGSYIFNTTFGLITVASSKSGSMLNFSDFTSPLGDGKSFGSSFLEWYQAQAPYQLWEREWYYGMILNGDPTLTLTP